jgi:hypothetical protein
MSLALWLLCTACTIHPKYTARYKSVTIVDNDPSASKTAKVSAFALDIPESAVGKSLTDLPERAQAQALAVLGAKTTNTKDFLASIGSPIGKKREKSGAEDRSIFKKRVVLAIENLATTAPADRFTFAELSLTFAASRPESPAAFVSWDKFATQYQTIDLGSLAYTQNREIDLSLAAKAPQGASAEVAAKNTNALQEQLMLRQRFISITGSLTAHEADLIQQGAPGIDLAGNVALDVTISVPAQRAGITITDFGDLADEKGNPTTPARLNLADRLIKTPNDPCHDVLANVTLRYILRHVVKGAETLVESDDIVQLRKGVVSATPVVLIPADELKLPVWTLQLQDEILHVQRLPGVAGGVPEPIRFDSFDQARAFLVWLNKTKAGEIQGRALLFPLHPFNPADSPQLLIVRTDENCDSVAGQPPREQKATQ